MSPFNRPPRAAREATFLFALLLCLAAGGAFAQAPTVNGLFYGDGDDARYSPYSTSIGGSILYSYLDAPNATLYVALVVSHSVNDLVCAPQESGPNSNLYVKSAGWGNHRDCRRASDSEFASFTLECAPGSPNAWSWRQALGCAQTAGPPPSNWASTASCPSSTGTWPPSIVASTSWVANVNAFQANPSPAWNLYNSGTAITNWKSPFLASAPNDVTVVPGYPTYSPAHEWEWSMVYEWAVNLGPGGTDCGDDPIFFITGESHHSPAKSGPENDTFPPPEDPIFTDWGDLPDVYGTTAASSGARHYIKISGPYLGQQIQAELDGQPTTDATGDGAEEDGVTVSLTSDWTPGSTQTIQVEVSNVNTANGLALLGAWFDWNNDGDFDDAGEFFTWNLTEGIHQLQITVGDDFDWQTDGLYARFRIFSSAAAAPGGSLTQADSVGLATDGEVEDYFWPPGTLPVTLNAFTSEGSPGGEVTVRWQTASETDNVAFEVWGRVAGRWQALTDLIQSRSMSSALPQSYEVRLAAPQGLTALKLVDYDTRGRIEQFGSYRVGESYGDFEPVRTIDWSGPRAEREARLRELGFADTAPALAPKAARLGGGGGPAAARWKKLRSGDPISGPAARHHGASAIAVDTRRGGPGGGPTSAGTVQIETGAMTHVAVTEPGVQRVTYEALRDGGLDLAGVHTRNVAVTWRGAPVERWIEGPPSFGPGSAIEFLGRPPAGQDALYIDASLYQVSVDPSLARDPRTLGQGKAKSLSASYPRQEWVDRPLIHHHQSPTGDPWVERSVLVRPGSGSTVTLDVPVEGPVADGPSRLVVGLGAVTNLPDRRDASGAVIPEHNVEVWWRGPGSDFAPVTTASASGHRDWTIEAELPSGWVEPGVNQVQLRFSTEYLFSLVLVDRYGVRYPSPYRGPSLDFAPDPWADGYRIEGFAGPSVAVYAEGAAGSLTRVEARVSASGDGYAAEVRQMDAKRFWVTEAPHAPAVFTTQAPPDLLAGPAELVVIAGSSFLGTPALDDYLAQRAAFAPVAVDVEDVYNAVGFGMALPSAIRDYLRARDAIHPFSHVQLVGTDCYDRLNHVSQCLSFIPLPTAPVGASLYAPSQNRLVDLTGDGVGDKAVAQFSVRDETELATIVGKGAAWDASGLSATRTALLIGEESDGLHNFSAQVERLRQRLGWSDVDVLHMAEHPNVQTARTAMRSSLDGGRALTVFSGHSSPTVWAFRSLLTPSTAATLTNHGRPTIMVPLACETTYDISPNANVLGHRLLFSGANGALAISGAVALSSLDGNERMANHVLDGLAAGRTLGEAVLDGRRAVGASNQELQDNWLTQGDVAVKLKP